MITRSNEQVRKTNYTLKKSKIHKLTDLYPRESLLEPYHFMKIKIYNDNSQQPNNYIYMN